MLDLLSMLAAAAVQMKGLEVFVLIVDVIEDRCDQFLDTAEDFAAQAIFGQVAEETLHYVQPRAAGRCEVQVKAGMAIDPAPDPGMFMGVINYPRS